VVIAEQTELRAERLRVTLFMFGQLHAEFDAMYADAAPRMSPSDHALFQSTNADDLALGNACLEIEYALRRRGWAALERLLAAIPPGGDIDSIYDLAAEQAIAAIKAAGVIGWHWPAAGA
jgi:hypothetical protein